MDWNQIIIATLGLITVIISVKWIKVKNLLKETSEALTALSEAIEDDKITSGELLTVKKEFIDVILAARCLVLK